MAQGFELNIDGLQEAINKAEQSITKLATTTKTQTQSIVTSFKTLSEGGLDVFVQKLNQANEVLSKIGNNTQGKGLKQVGTDATSSIDAINKLIDVLNKLYEEQNKGTKKKRSDSSEAQVAQVNKLYRERIDAMKKLSQIMQAGAKGQDIGSDYISSLRSQIMATESAIQKIKERGNVSKAALKAISQGEMEYILLLEKEDKKVKELNAKSKATKKSEAQYAANTTFKGSLKFSNNAQTLEQEKKAIEYLEAAKRKLNNTDANYQQKLDQLNTAIRKHEENLKRAGRTAEENAETEKKAAAVKKKAADLLNQQKEFKKNTTFSGAMAYSQQTKSINDQIKAIQYLKIARDNLDKGRLGAKEYENRVKQINKEIVKQQTEVRRLQGQTTQSFSQMSNVASQLQSRLATVFGIAAIKGYVGKLIQVRGEFEMQQRSLEVLLQSKDKADKLWQQTIDLAVKSPFTTKQLVTYTKQLAAYRIESEKLFETNKMLADVSAGLGVDMNRLILAFGQVKAANFLRGTELRQFSEAGVNMLDELAKRFTALEGKAVSVGDVFERVSKRMVSFKDVEAVFQTITSEGGIFYEMQAKQSETLKGMILNLKDSVELMMNSIGQLTDGALKGGVELAKELVENWRSLRDNLRLLILALTIAKVGMYGYSTAMNANINGTLLWSKKLTGLHGVLLSEIKTLTMAEARALGMSKAKFALAKATRVATLAVRGLGIALTRFLPFAIITAIIELGYWLFSASEAAKQLEEGIEGVNKSIKKDLQDNLSLYIQLAQKIQDVTTSEEERTQALQKMRSALGEILPDQLLELEYIKGLKGNYDKATEAMQNYYNIKSLEQKKEVVRESYGKATDEEVAELKKDIEEAFTDDKKSYIDRAYGKGVYDKIMASYEWAIDKARADVESGKINADDFGKAMFENISYYSGIASEDIEAIFSGSVKTFGNNIFTGLRDVNFNIKNVTDALKNYSAELDNVISKHRTGLTANEEQALKEAEEMRKEIETAKKNFNDLAKLAQKIAKEGRDLESDKEATKLIQATPLLFQEAIKTFWDSMLATATSNDGELLINTYMNGITDAFYEQIGNISKAFKEGNTIIANDAEELGKTLDKKVITEKGEAVTEIYQEVAKNFKIDSDVFSKYILTAEKSIDDVRKELKAQADAYLDEAKAIKSSLSKVKTKEDKDAFKKLWGFSVDDAEKEIEKLENKAAAFLDSWERVGGVGKDEKEKKDKQIKILNKRISLVKELHEKYKELNKSFNGAEARDKVLDAYGDTFKEAFEGTGIKLSGLVIDTTTLDKIKKEGEDTGKVFSEAMTEKMNQVIESGTYIRSANKEFIENLRKEEGKRNQLYDDSTGAVIKNAKDWAKKVGTATIGFGHAIDDFEEAKKYLGRTLSDAEVEQIFINDIKEHEQDLNKVLDKYNELIITQEQYNVFLDRTFQGGAKVIKAAIDMATNIDMGIAHFNTLDKKLKKVGMSFDTIFGEDFIDRFKNAESVAERLALVLETINLTTKASGSNIDTGMFKGMLKRSQDLAKAFRGDVEIVKLLEKASVNISKIDFTNVEGVVATLKSLRPIAEREGEEAMLALSKAISAYEAIIELDIRVKDNEAIEKVFNDMFQDYEMTMKLESEGLNANWWGEMFGFKPTTLDQIRKSIQKNLGLTTDNILTDSEINAAILNPELKLPEDQIKVFQNALKQLGDAEMKELEERAKQFLEYGKNALTSVGQIRLAEAQEITRINDIIDKEIEKAGDDIEKIENLNKMRPALLDGVKDKADANAKKAEWEELKGSEGFVRLFQDAQYATNKSINRMLEELEKFKNSLGDMNVDEIKAVVEAMEKLENIKLQRHPFAGMIDAISDIRKNKEERGEASVSPIPELDIDGVKKGGFKGRKGKKNLDKSIQQYDNAIQKMEKVRADAAKKGNKEEVTTTDITIKALRDKKKALEQMRDAGEDANARLAEGAVKFGAKLNEIGGSLSVFQSSLENMGVGFSDGMKDAIATTQEVFGGVSEMVQGIASGNYLQALMGLFKTLGALFQISDKKKEREIQSHIKAIEKLEKAYEKLEKAVDEAYSIDTLQSATNSAMDNLEQQIEKQEAIIALEKEKKKTDEDKLEEYNDQLVEQKEQLEELKKEAVSKATAGAFDDLLSVADGFVDAWLEAFNETGDGLQGLEKNFNEFMMNIVKRQAAMQIVGAFTKNWEKELAKYVNENDTEFTTEEIKAYADAIKQDFPELSERLKAFFESLQGTLDITGEGGDTMSGLQRGISEISEETAGIIAAYLESVRFFVADNNNQLKQLLANLNPTITTTPILSELKAQTELIRTIDERLSSVIGRGGSTHSGAYLKVSI